MDKLDVADPELVDLVILDVVELLEQHGYGGGPIVRGSAVRALEGDPARTATIDELLATMDRAIPTPVRDVTSPFLMTVEGVHTIEGIGTVVTGRVGRGVIRVGDTALLIDSGKPRGVPAAAVRWRDRRDGATFGLADPVEPGARAEIELALDRAIALEAGVRFAVREGGRTIGAGVVTEVGS